jgi:hypothetical protein
MSPGVLPGPPTGEKIGSLDIATATAGTFAVPAFLVSGGSSRAFAAGVNSDATDGNTRSPK